MNQPAENDWSQQVKSVLDSPNAILNLIKVAIVWKLIGLVLGILFNFGMFIIFVVIYYTVLWLFPYWQPAYSIVYRIVGNKNISPTLKPIQLKWWQLISPTLRIGFLAYLLFLGIKLLIK